MIGIDIVDFTDSLLKTRSTKDLRFIRNNNDDILDHPQLFWILWSAKESVFKASRELTRFKPKAIPIKLISQGDTLTFKSTFTSLSFEGSIKIENSYILSYCHPPGMRVSIAVFDGYNQDWPSRIRAHVVDYFQKKNIKAAVASDDDGLPVLMPSGLPISFSHHHDKGAFIYSHWIN